MFILFNSIEFVRRNKNNTYDVELAIGPVESVCQPIKSQNANVMNASQ